MKAILPEIKSNSSKSLYFQLYEYIRSAILSNEIVPGEKLPSLRNLSESLSLSLTTVETAYSQLVAEGYIHSRPKSGYFAGTVAISTPNPTTLLVNEEHPFRERTSLFTEESESYFLYDLTCFDFTKWKKCLNSVLSGSPELLLSEGAPQGEEALRIEIVKYIYSSRGVRATPAQVIIGAGTQQITAHLSTVLRKMAINHVAVEDPGYLPVQNTLRDMGFFLNPIPVEASGIFIEKLPCNVPSAVYVNPSNQFPTGAVMPIGRRYALLDWAYSNNSYIIEDDYDSELRYFGRPIPALCGLDTGQRVIYLGSFSSTLFPAVKISYMVVPPTILTYFDHLWEHYSQTCSKTEQLALAMFMKQGHYYKGIRKLRRLYRQKLAAVKEILARHPEIAIEGSTSGISMLLSVCTTKDALVLAKDAQNVGVLAVPAPYPSESEGHITHKAHMVFYYNRIPIESMSQVIQRLLNAWL